MTTEEMARRKDFCTSRFLLIALSPPPPIFLFTVEGKIHEQNIAKKKRRKIHEMLLMKTDIRRLAGNAVRNYSHRTFTHKAAESQPNKALTPQKDEQIT